MATTHCGDGGNSTVASGQTLVDGMLLHYFVPFAKSLFYALEPKEGIHFILGKLV